MRTNDPLIARRLAVIVAAESMKVFDQMADYGLTKDEARKLLQAIIARELRQIELRRAAASDTTSIKEFASNTRADWAMGMALQILSQRGAAGEELSEGDITKMLADGRNAAEIEDVQYNLDIESQAFRHGPGEGANSRALHRMRETFGRHDFSSMELMEGRQIWYRGRAAALLTSLKDDNAFDAAMDLASHLASGKDLSEPQPATSKPAQAEPPSEYDPNLMQMVERLMDQKRRNDVSDQMIGQMSKVFELFSEATGVTEMSQAHLAKFVDTLRILLTTYRKSSKDKDKSLSQILAEAKAKGKYTGLSVTTINRNLGDIIFDVPIFRD